MVVATLNESAPNAELRHPDHWALPIQERHFQDALDGSPQLAAEEDPDADA